MTAIYLTPSNNPIYGDQLDDIFHDIIAGICGIVDGSLIRPRWQPEPPDQPDFTTDWVAFGIQFIDGDKFTYQGHDPLANGGVGADIVEQDEVLKVLLSFYGPNCSQLASQYRMGIQVDSNRADLIAVGIKLIEVMEAHQLPALLKEKWVKRLDVSATFKRRIKRTYAVSSLLLGSLELNNEQYVTPIPLP